MAGDEQRIDRDGRVWSLIPANRADHGTTDVALRWRSVRAFSSYRTLRDLEYYRGPLQVPASR